MNCRRYFYLLVIGCGAFWSGSTPSYGAAAANEDEDHCSATSSPVKADQRDPWELSRPIVERGGIREAEQIDQLAGMALQLQTSFEDASIREWVALGAEYAAKVQRKPSACDDVIRLVTALAEVDEKYPRRGFLTSRFVYEALMTDYCFDLPPWPEQEHYMWSAASAFQATNNPAAAQEIMSRSLFWITPSHTAAEKNTIIRLVSEIILNKPYVYRPTLDRVQQRFGPSFFERSAVIPFLQGLHAGTWADVEVQTSSSSSGSLSDASAAESEEEGTPLKRKGRDDLTLPKNKERRHSGEG